MPKREVEGGRLLGWPDRKRAFRARAVALGIPVYDEIANAGLALAALAFHERFLANRQKRDS